jgi:hypothetical protein
MSESSADKVNREQKVHWEGNTVIVANHKQATMWVVEKKEFML